MSKIDEAIKDLNDSLNLLYDPIHPMPKAEILSKISRVKLFLESEPEPIKFPCPDPEGCKHFEAEIALHDENKRLREALIAADKTFDAYYEGREGQECTSAVKVKQALKGESNE